MYPLHTSRPHAVAEVASFLREALTPDALTPEIFPRSVSVAMVRRLVQHFYRRPYNLREVVDGLIEAGVLVDHLEHTNIRRGALMDHCMGRWPNKWRPATDGRHFEEVPHTEPVALPWVESSSAEVRS
jgi:hypothetical protein